MDSQNSSSLPPAEPSSSSATAPTRDYSFLRLLQASEIASSGSSEEESDKKAEAQEESIRALSERLSLLEKNHAEDKERYLAIIASRDSDIIILKSNFAARLAELRAELSKMSRRLDAYEFRRDLVHPSTFEVDSVPARGGNDDIGAASSATVNSSSLTPLTGDLAPIGPKSTVGVTPLIGALSIHSSSTFGASAKSSTGEGLSSTQKTTGIKEEGDEVLVGGAHPAQILTNPYVGTKVVPKTLAECAALKLHPRKFNGEYLLCFCATQVPPVITNPRTNKKSHDKLYNYGTMCNCCRTAAHRFRETKVKISSARFIELYDADKNSSQVTRFLSKDRLYLMAKNGFLMEFREPDST